MVRRRTVGVRSIAMSMSVVRLSVCPIAQLQNHMAEHHQCFVHAAYGRGSVLIWKRCDTLCISGFLHDVMFSYNGSVAHCVYSWAAKEHDKHNSRDSNQVLLSDKDRKYSLLPYFILSYDSTFCSNLILIE